MKKMVAVLLAVVMLSMTACSGGSGSTATQAASGVAGTSTEAAGIDGAGTEAALTIKIGTTSSANGMPSRAAYYFQERLNEISGGAITCEVNIAGTLGNTAQHYAQLKNGTLDLFVTAYDTFTVLENGEDFTVCVVPYAFDDIDHFMRWTESDLYDEMIAKVEDVNGLKVLGPMGELYPRGLSTTDTPVYTVEDVENLKIRCPETKSIMEVWKAWGANPVIIAAGELYTSLDSGLCDGQENDIITTNNGAYGEIQDYYMELDYIQQCTVTVASKQMWDKLDDTQKGWIEQAVQETHEGFTEELKGEYDTAKNNMIENNGVEFIEADLDSFRNAAAEAVKSMDGELFTAGLYDQIRALAE